MASTPRIALLFPGQGSQYVGMGKDFWQHHLPAKRLFEEAGDILHRTFTDLLFDGAESELTQTKNSQPAIYLVSLAILEVIKSCVPLPTPLACAGLSLGEYTALTASGHLGFGEGMAIVGQRGEAMHRACEERKGAMSVILGMDDEAVEALISQLNPPHEVWVANYNCPGQVAISGTDRGVEAATEAALKVGARKVLPLTVHGAFHSPLMEPAETTLAPLIMALSLNKSEVRVATNVTGTFSGDPHDMKRDLVRQVSSPVRWHQCVRAIDGLGLDYFIEVGCDKLGGLNKRIQPRTPTLSIKRLEDMVALEKILTS